MTIKFALLALVFLTVGCYGPIEDSQIRSREVPEEWSCSETRAIEINGSPTHIQECTLLADGSEWRCFPRDNYCTPALGPVSTGGMGGGSPAETTETEPSSDSEPGLGGMGGMGGGSGVSTPHCVHGCEPPWGSDSDY